MATTSSRTIQVGFSGDVNSQVVQSALENDASPSEYDILTLSAGNNVIPPPVVSGILVTGLTIIPPAGNEVVITLKGEASDTGFPLHLTDPSSFGLDESFDSLVLSVSDDIVGVRLIWS